MDDLSRAVGRLEGSVESIGKDVRDIKKKVDGLQHFKWKVAGGATVLSIIAGILAKMII